MKREIGATCPHCGHVHLATSEVELYLPPASPECGRYAFVCPSCRTYVSKPAHPDTVSMLASAGVVVRAAPPEALEPHDGPAIGYDDLPDLLIGLDGDDQLAPLALEESG